MRPQGIPFDYLLRADSTQFCSSIAIEIDLDEERKVLYPGRAPHVWVGPRGRAHVGGGRAPVVVERKQDRIEKDGDHRIVFAAITSNDIDGFNFKVDKNVTTLAVHPRDKRQADASEGRVW